MLRTPFFPGVAKKLLVNDTLHKRYVAQIVSTVVLNSEIEILFAYTILYYDSKSGIAIRIKNKFSRQIFDLENIYCHHINGIIYLWCFL